MLMGLFKRWWLHFSLPDLRVSRNIFSSIFTVMFGKKLAQNIFFWFYGKKLTVNIVHVVTIHFNLVINILVFLANIWETPTLFRQYLSHIACPRLGREREEGKEEKKKIRVPREE